MNGSAILMMIVILTVVWGGFFLCLFTALKRERERRGSGK